jgi:hypothetical protein
MPIAPETAADAASLASRIQHRIQRADFTRWRARIEATGGCLQPIQLAGHRTITHRTTGTVLERAHGRVTVPCGNRRESVCPACSERYSADAFHLIRAGLAGDTAKNIPVTVADAPRAFITFTAPSFGSVHNRRTSHRGKAMPCACGEYHPEADTRLGQPLDPDAYDYTGAVLWQAHATALWARTVTTLRREVAKLTGIPTREASQYFRLSYSKVAEYQRRGLVHFHAVARIDGPAGPTDPPPFWATTELLDHAVRQAAASALTVARPDGTPMPVHWGAQLDIRPVTGDDVETDDGAISEGKLAGYVAKYATKGTGKTEAADRPIRSEAHIGVLDINPHHRRLIETCWQLGGVDDYADLGLRRWAHMLGFRGHFLTKSQAYSTTLTALRGRRATHALAQRLDALGAEPDSVAVVNDWRFASAGLSEAEREIAAAIHQRKQAHRKNTAEGRAP